MNKKWFVSIVIVGLLFLLLLLYLLFMWLSIPWEFPEEYPDCFEESGIFSIEDFKCVAGVGGFLEFKLNTDSKKFDDMVLRFHNRSSAEFGMYEFGGIESSDGFYNLTFPLEQEGTYPSVLWSISFLEVRGYIYDSDENIECISRVAEKVNCS